jgi:hypothetical protein
MKTSVGRIRSLIKEILLREFGQATSASGTDPTDPKGFYPYEIDRGIDIHGFWYKSPGRPVGSDGDPYRPEDAAAFLGMKKPEEPAPEGEEGSEGEGPPGTDGEGEDGETVPGAESPEEPA